MNCHEIAEYWDDYRDGMLGSQDRGRFAGHLAACGRCARLYERETGYLAALREPAPGSDAKQDAFVEAVLDRWAEPARPLAVLRWRVPAAALIALGAVVSAALLISATDEPAQVAGTPAPEVVQAEEMAEAVDPVSVLMLDMTRHLDKKPSQLRETIDQTASANLRALVDLFAEMDQPQTPPLRNPRS